MSKNILIKRTFVPYFVWSLEAPTTAKYGDDKKTRCFFTSSVDIVLKRFDRIVEGLGGSVVFSSWH